MLLVDGIFWQSSTAIADKSAESLMLFRDECIQPISLSFHFQFN